MSDLISALEDLKSELRAGKSADDVIDEIAVDNGLRPIFLRNRAAAVLGDLSTWADRERAADAALAPSLEIAAKKMALAKLERKIRAHNAGAAILSEAALGEAIEAANELAGHQRWTLRQPAPRRRSRFDNLTSDQFLSLIDRLLALH